MDLTAYGHTFKDQRSMDAYKKMKANSRAKALSRKINMDTDEKEKASIRKHFNSEARFFKLK